jgi:hypothetical protein
MRFVCFVATLFLATGAVGCDWPIRSLPENDRLSEAVFVATVIGRESTKTIELEVGELFKGSVPGRVRIPTVNDCDYFADSTIQSGERFLVFLIQTKEGMRAGLGGGTSRFVEGNPDIVYMRTKYRK